jgi:glycosyltransferase involved in cell wall biosynthesis
LGTEGGASPKGRKTIALVVPSFEDPGGVPAVAEFILRTIAKRPDLTVRVISLATSAQDPCSVLGLRPSTWLRGVRCSQARERGHDLVHVGAQFGDLEFQRLAPRPALTRALLGCDLIQVVAGAPAWAIPVIGLGRPVVLQAATLTKVERRARARSERGLLALWRALMTLIVAGLDEAALRRVDVVALANPWMLAHAKALGKSASIRALYAPPGVDMNLFRPAGPEELPAEKPYILSVARFSDVRKNPSLLLRAYTRLTQRVGEAPDLILAGPDAPDATFWACVEQLNLSHRIRFIQGPSINALARLFRRALCLALSSDEEGFGMVVIEAMASGVPVVSTRCGGPEGIITDGLDGYLVDRDDADGMSDRFARLVCDPKQAQAMGRRALATVISRYADDVAGAAYLNLYDELLGLGFTP